MNFFDAQDKARRTTRWLVLVYIVATILIVAGITAVVGASSYMFSDGGRPANPALLGTAAAVATLFILGATAYKVARLSSGGGRVAQDMGGTLVAPNVQDPLRRRYRNVVEEMAIASGVPVPEIYVLEEEDGINAFAAGYSTGDAAVAVTRGCLELLDRDELQGVIAHEFSHILNGDMRLNIRMMGVLFGIMVVGMIGRLILRGTYHGRAFSGRRNKGAPVVLIIGLGLVILGWIGVFAARLIKAAVSRQREFLADASAVQFTRQTDGIADALKKIGGYSAHSYITRADPEEVSHMLFAGGIARLTSLFATHPPLIERIRALDPQFAESDYPRVDLISRKRAQESDQVSAFSAPGNVALKKRDSRSIGASVSAQVGRPEAQHVQYAQKLRASIPAMLYDAAHAPDDALLLAVALSISENETTAEQQLHIVEEQIGAERTGSVRQLHAAIVEAGAAYRLPLLEVAFPSLKNRPAPQIEFLFKLVRKIVQSDGKVALREYCYYRILQSQLLQSVNPAGERGNRVAKKIAQQAAVDLVGIVADASSTETTTRQRAFAAGIATFGAWAKRYSVSPGNPVATLDKSLTALANLNSAGKQSMLQAVSEAITQDGRITLDEAELLRTVSATLHCPLPPILADTPANSGD